MNVIELAVAIFSSVLASSGMWAFLLNRADKKDTRNQMLIGLGHDRIMQLGMEYLRRGWIEQDEYENLKVYLFTPYKKLGGNGSAERIMNEVEKLPIAGTNVNYPRKEK